MQKSAPVDENRLLKQMGDGDLASLQSHLKRVSLTQGTVLYAADAAIDRVYFPLSGMVSILAVMRTGELIETAIIGREGVVGASVGADGTQSPGQATVQIAGLAWQIEASKFIETYKASAHFRTLINRFQGVVLRQAQQSAACHAIHSIEARLCRWLLLSQDITGSDTIALTQDFLSHMLGVRRTSVSLCAHALQKTGLIQYSRGKIKILNRDGLQECACECYEVVREQLDKMAPPA